MMVFEERNKTLVINDVIALTKVFDGDIFGGAVRDFKVIGINKIKDIDIRLDSVYYKPFVTLLHTKYTVKHLPDKTYNGIVINCYELYSKEPSVFFFPIKLDIVLMNKHLFKISFLDFDTNLLTENEKAIYIRYIPSMIKYIPDKLSYIKDRIISRTFTYLPSERPQLDLWAIVDKAVQMVNANWTMDDNCHAKDTWVVAKWDSIINSFGKHRKKFNPEKYNKIVSCNTCSLCHEKFNPEDTVLNTVCNHVFHWKCNPETGLSNWAKEHSTCPYCRSEMF